MSIVKKTVIIVCFTSILLLVLMYLVSDYFYLKGFKDLEIQTVERNIQRVNETVAAKLDAMDTFCYDWAAWDDTYFFTREYNQTYVDRNFHEDTFTNAKINIIAIQNTHGDMILGKAYDFTDNREITVPEDFSGVVSDQKLVNSPVKQAGVIMVSGRPMLVVSEPILTSLAEGPSPGTIIMGRYVDAELLDSLSAITSFPVNLVPVSDTNSDPALKNITSALSESGPVYIKIQSKKLITGYTYVNDIAGSPILLVELDRYRDIYNRGLDVIGVWHVSMLFVCIVFGIVQYLLIKKFFLSRFTTLNENVNKISSSSDLSLRVPVTGKDEISRLTGNVNTMLDSLEKSESKLRHQQEVIGYIVNDTPNAVLATDESGHVVMVNKSFAKMFGLDEKEVIGRSYISLTQLGNLLPETKVFLDGGSQKVTREFQYKYNGTKKTFIVNFARLNEEKVFFVILTDVTEEHARQERLYLTHRLASVGEMASGIAHELNNPLTGIIGLSELLMDEKVPDSIREDLSAINNEAKRSASVVKNMLSFARKHSPSKQPVQINRIIDDVLALRRHEQRNHNIQVVKQLSPDLPEIIADPFQIQQVFINVILNAEQAMVDAHGKGTLTVSSEKAGNYIRVSFTDDGPGIDPQNIHRIFDPFFTTKEVGQGTGLGLSICYGIITAHEGLIYAQNENGKGATFFVELPVK
jgi:PAS domain S-box-containing protein